MNRVLLDLGIVQIYWYSICILVGMMIGMFLVYRETIKKYISDSLITNLIFYTIIVAIIGARLYYVIFDWNSFASNPIEIFEIWNGGLAIHGAIILGGIFLISYTKQHKLDTLMVLDICSVGLIIGQAIGRWGNFFNQEVFGGEVSLSFLKGLHLPEFIINGMHIGGAYHHPLFLYESLWCILGFIILLIIRRRKYIKTGQIFGVYCMWYSFGRFFLEGIRDPEYNLTIGTFKVAQIVSIGMFLVGAYFFIRRLKTSRFEYLYNDDGVKVETTEENEEKPFFGTSDGFNGTQTVPETSPSSTTPQVEEPIKESVPFVNPELTVTVQKEPVIPQTVPVQNVLPQVIDTTPVQDDFFFQPATGPILNNNGLNNEQTNNPIVDQNNTQQ